MEFRYQEGERRHVVRVIEQEDGLEIRIGDRRYHVQPGSTVGARLDFRVDGHFVRAHVAAEGEERWVALGSEIVSARLEERRRRKRAAGSGEDTLAATMPGQIVAVEVAAGDAVERGQTLVVMEAMKMELRVTAPHDGTVQRILVAPGDAVERGQTLVQLGGTAE